MPICRGLPPPCEGGQRHICAQDPANPESPFGVWTCFGYPDGMPPEDCPTGMDWDARLKTCVPAPTPPPTDTGCPPGYHHKGGHPGNPCVPDAVAPPAPGAVPKTITEMVNRFYTPDFENYMLTGMLEPGIPQPEGDLLTLLQNNLFQRALGQYRVAPLQWPRSQERLLPRERMRPNLGHAAIPPYEAPEKRLSAVLGLPGGGAAYGYIDPAWRQDYQTKTQMVPAPPLYTNQILGNQKKKPQQFNPAALLNPLAFGRVA